MNIVRYVDWIDSHIKPPPFVEKGAVMIGIGMAKSKENLGPDELFSSRETLLTWVVYQFAESRLPVFVVMFQHSPIDEGESIEKLVAECHFAPHPICSSWFSQWSQWYPVSLIEGCSYETLRNACSALPFHWRWER